MKTFTTYAGRVMLGCTLGFLNVTASAAMLWDFGSGCVQNAANKNKYGNSFECSSGADNPTSTATAWSNTGNTKTRFQTANIVHFSGTGFGVRNRTETLSASSPQHAMDGNGNIDLIALAFSDVVVLTEVTLGWMQTDSDISVLRYTGADAPDIKGQSVPGLLSGGWELVGSNANLTVGTARSVNPLGLASSWWLVSAFSSSYGESGTGFGNGNDYVKLRSVAATMPPPPPGKVPEPGTAALFGVAIAGLYASRRRSKA